MTAKKKKKPRNPRREKFARLYAISGDPAESYQGAGYKVSRSVARRAAHRLLTYDDVIENVNKWSEKLGKRLEVTEEQVLNELRIMGFSNISDYLSFDSTGVTLKSSDDIDREKLAAISQVGHRTAGEKVHLQFKLYDKLSALEKIARIKQYLKPPSFEPDDGTPIGVLVVPAKKPVGAPVTYDKPDLSGLDAEHK